MNIMINAYTVPPAKSFVQRRIFDLIKKTYAETVEETLFEQIDKKMEDYYRAKFTQLATQYKHYFTVQSIRAIARNNCIDVVLTYHIDDKATSTLHETIVSIY